MAVALVVAAGRGERLGMERPKAFVSLAGRPMLEWSIEALRSVSAIEEIVVALPGGQAAPPGCIGVEGGVARSDSVLAALRAASAGGDPVVVHDAARPLVTPALIESVLAALGDADGAIAAAPVADTIKEADADGIVVRTLDRAGLWAVQTPQVFRRTSLERALDVDASLRAAATDDAWLVERLGGRVRIVAAPPGNLKVTTPHDAHLADALLGARDQPA
jgi:2-C-methyl-D-erythritol 4-phosphate cytidylyltransferase